MPCLERKWKVNRVREFNRIKVELMWKVVLVNCIQFEILLRELRMILDQSNSIPTLRTSETYFELVQHEECIVFCSIYRKSVMVYQSRKFRSVVGKIAFSRSYSVQDIMPIIIKTLRRHKHKPPIWK